MIASGKSTYARNAAQAGVLCVNDDAIVNMFHADRYDLYEKALKPIYKSVENHALTAAVVAGRTVLVDRGLNVSLRGRRRWLAIAASFDVPIEAIVFPRGTPMDHAYRRYEHDRRGLNFAAWLEAAEQHDSEYVEPTAAEGFAAIHHITFEEIRSGKVVL